MTSMLRVDDFAYRYEVSVSNVYVKKSEGLIAPYAFSKNSGGSVYVNEDFFLRRKEFKKKVWLQSHDMYYFLTKHLSDTAVSKLLNKIDNSISYESWNTFLATALFSNSITSILSYQVNDLAWKFYRYARWLIRAIFIKAGIPPKNRDIAIILDNY